MDDQRRSAPDPPPSDPRAPGRRLGPYRLIRSVGAGGMGEVYLAEDSRLGRKVTLKFLPAELTRDPDRLQRFRREARTASALNHPNIVTIHEVGEADGVHFIAAEFVDGQTLRQRLAEGPLAPADAVAIALQVGEALACAHAAGVTHRDVKPENIMVRADGYAKLLDFSIAKATANDGATGDDTATAIDTDPGAVLGTPRYMSPEQATGERLDARTDVFSFGAVVYEMLTGRAPFEGGSPAEVIAALLTRDPPPVSSRAAGVPPAIAGVVHHALAKRREERLATIEEFVAVLARFREGWHQAPATTTRAWPGARRALLAAAVLLAAALAGGSAVWFRGTAEHTPDEVVRPSVAVLGFRDHTGRTETAWLSTALSEMLATELATGERVRTVPGESVARMKIELGLAQADSYAPDTLANIRRNVGATFVVAGSYLVTATQAGRVIRVDARLQDAATGAMVATLSETGRESELLDLVARAGTQLRARLGATGTASVSSGSRPANPEAARLYALGLDRLRSFDALGARDLLEQAVSADPRYPMAHAALAEAWARLGHEGRSQAAARQAYELSEGLRREEALMVEGRYREAIHEWSAAIGTYRQLLDTFPGDLDHGLRLADAQISGGQAEDALETVAVLRRLPEPGSGDPRIDLAEARALGLLARAPEARRAAASAAEIATARGARLLLAHARVREASALLELGEFDPSKAALAEANGLFRSMGDHGGAADVLNIMGILHWREGQLARAGEVWAEALGINQAIGARKDVAVNLQNTGILRYDQGDLSGARELYEASLAVYREIDNKRGMASLTNSIANVLADQGDAAGAARLYGEAVALSREIGARSDEAIAQNNIAILTAEQGQLVEARRLFEEALVLKREIGNESSVAYTLHGLGDVLLTQGLLEEARGAYDEALDIRDRLKQESTGAETRLALAKLRLEEGRPSDADRMAREALAHFTAARRSLFEADARAVVSRLLLAAGQAEDARREIEKALGLAAEGGTLGQRLGFAVHAARVEAVSGRPEAAAIDLRRLMAEARKAKLVAVLFEARLALAEVRVQDGVSGAERRDVDALVREAEAQSFHLVARKATRLIR